MQSDRRPEAISSKVDNTGWDHRSGRANQEWAKNTFAGQTIHSQAPPRPDPAGARVRAQRDPVSVPAGAGGQRASRRGPPNWNMRSAPASCPGGAPPVCRGVFIDRQRQLMAMPDLLAPMLAAWMTRGDSSHAGLRGFSGAAESEWGDRTRALNAAVLLHEAGARALLPPPGHPGLRVGRQNRRADGRRGGRKGQWRTRHYQREPMDVLSLTRAGK